jgi:hypothetical protein
VCAAASSPRRSATERVHGARQFIPEVITRCRRREPSDKASLAAPPAVSLLQEIIRAAMISQNSVIVVRTLVTSVCRSWLMSLTITFVFGPPKLQMKPASGATDARRKPAQLAVPKLRVEGVSYASTSVGPATVGGGCNATSSVLASSSESDVLITGPPYGWSAAIALPGSDQLD